ncbi:protein-L-isoaspartate(D-aspartate) O-methyltransferase [Vaginella massiliensis]|uniref:protein-L-isoaspartate(D-aspartate) O-methyltransferase n=1 Tax=Vaginella massiliensis TaxID=1816680 RepID=UPI0008389E76|nr:protein-L-isoaspartate(D-aspartate) O-methyltransferase [Vaginella massiliensis]
MPIDEFKHKGKRKQLIETLHKKGIEDENVLLAMNMIPRHLFIDSAFEEFAYRDEAFPIAAGQTISHPYTVAFQTSLLHVNKGEKILEIGTGSGYQTAVLVAMGADVYTIERQKELFDFSRIILNKIKFKPKYQTFGDGYKGLPAFAPFDKIIVTAGAPELPQELLKQLRIGGILVIPIGKVNQKMYTYLRLNENDFEVLEFGDYQFVPMLESTNK